MADSLPVLLLTAASVGFFHTLMGPDHYLPFIVMAKSGNWTRKKTLLVTIFCGFGHVLSSVFIGVLLIILGSAIIDVELIETVRSDIAAWGLIIFGITYMIWGFKRIRRNKSHEHSHTHFDGEKHSHEHIHNSHHSHLHKPRLDGRITPWVLFLIFVLGPCEPFIPLMIYPALHLDLTAVLLVSVIFLITTIITMLAIVMISLYGVNFFPYKYVEKYAHTIAGATILFCGIAIQFYGL